MDIINAVGEELFVDANEYAWHGEVGQRKVKRYTKKKTVLMVKKHVKQSQVEEMQSAMLDFTHAHLMVILVDNVNLVNTKIKSIVLVHVKLVQLDNIRVRRVRPAVQHVQLVNTNLVQVPPVAVHAQMQSTKHTEVRQAVQHVQLDAIILP